MARETAKLALERRLVLGCTGAVFALWLMLHFTRLSADQNGAIRFFLGLLFGALIFFRSKRDAPEWSIPPWALAAAAAAGAAGVLVGIIAPIHQLEWLGLLLLFAAALIWALPRNCARDVLAALLIVYWVHPLPGQIFAPLELGMQRLSVLGAERLLHTANFPAWVDGLSLRTGLRIFEVPEACSGMKTAITVLLCTLALGVMKHLRWGATLGLAGIGLIQVLVLNMARIAALVKLGANKPPEWSPNALHDTVAVFLFIAVGMVYLEIELWERWQRRRARRRELEEADDAIGEPEDRARMLPRFWRGVFRWSGLAVAALLLAAAAALMAYRSLPGYRARMIARVVEGLSLSNLEAGERAVAEGLRLDPGNEDLKLARIRILFMRQRYPETIAEIRKIPANKLGVEQRVMEARALFVTGSYDEALRVMNALPAETRDWPGVAMIYAEFAAIKDQPREAAANVVKAARWPVMVERIRALFPYLAAREQWQAIVQADPNLPYREPLQALLVATANLRVNRIDGAIAAMRRGIDVWPQEPLFLDPLLALAILRPGSEWEELFAHGFHANLPRLAADDLARYLEACFLARRPDLAWEAYRRLAALDPRDPSLYEAAALHAANWFSFRRQFLGVQAETADQPIDVLEFCRLTRGLEPWRSLWEQVPLCAEMLNADRAETRAKYLQLCLEELQRRDAAGKLPLRMQRMFPRVLALLGKMQEAHARLDRLDAEHPADRKDILLQRAGLYEQEKRWADVYETMRLYFTLDPQPALLPGLRLVNALMRLNLGVYAKAVMDDIWRSFPEAEEARARNAELWSYYGFPEEALFAVLGLKAARQMPVTARLMYATGRIVAARKLAPAVGIDTDEFPAKKQSFVPPPADWTLEWKSAPLTAEDCDREIAALDPAEDGQHPFVRPWRQLQREWLSRRGAGDVSDPARWRSAGRDAREQAQALHTLAVLLARQGRTAEARGAIQSAGELMPESAVIWRVAIALSRGDPNVVNAAWRRCPHDPDIWLAELVNRQKAEGAGPWAAQEIERAVSNRFYAADDIVRAGDYFLRQKALAPAVSAAQYAIRDGEGLLPAYVLGLRCAIAQTNRTWALECALGGVENALEPWPFYKLIVGLKAQERKIDADMVRALESLNVRYPDEYQWARWLGDVYFSRGDMTHALGVLDDAWRRRGIKGMGPRAMLLAAEAARLEGRTSQAIDILEAAHAEYPANLSVLNNLVYYMAQNPATLPRAMERLPELLSVKDSFAVIDTVAMVYLRSGQMEKAAEYMRKALTLVNKGAYAWHELYLNAAEVQIAQGDVESARKLIETVRKDSSRTSAIENRARELHQKAMKKP